MSSGRILILTNRVPFPLNDGGNLAMKAMVDGYNANGWDVFLLSMNTKRHYVPATTLATIYRNTVAFETVDIDNSVRLVPLLTNFFFSKEPEHAVRFNDKAFAKKLSEVLATFKPDVVQVESLYLSAYMPVIRQYKSIKTVLRLHNVEYQVWQRLAEETANDLKKLYLHNLAKRIKHFEERIWKEYDLLLPITHNDEGMVKQMVADAPTYVVPFGIDTKKIFQPKGVEDWTGYHIGAMDWLPNREGIEWFLEEAWPLIRKQVPDFTFAFAGRNMPQSFPDMHIDGVACAGEVPDAEAFIADKKMLIVPIRSGGGIRVKILEAMAAGKVVISTAVGMQGIDAEEGKHYLKADTAITFAEAVKWCMEHKAEAERMGEEAKKLIINHYNLSVIAQGLSEKLLGLKG
ncbi:MAG: glycosyltransferase [Chitinophagaceae bacterium]|nr:glycosyltransferase [Chitinophagaceae bacterium]